MASTLHAVTAAQARALRRVGGEADARLLELMASALKQLKAPLAKVDIGSNSEQANLPDSTVVRTLVLLQDIESVIRPLAKKEVLADLGRLIILLERHPTMPLSEFLDRMLHGTKVRDSAHSDRLKSTFGNEGFESAIATAVGDRKLTTEEFAEISKTLGYKPPRRASKKKIGNDLLTLHRDLLTFRAKKDAMGGRSAA